MEEREKLPAREKEILKVTWTGSITNFMLLAFKFVAGILGHSSAMIADAVHSLSDFVTDIIVILFVRISGKPEDESHRYGHGKYETLATAIIGIILFGAGIVLLAGGAISIAKVIEGETLQAPTMLALVAATVSIATKEVLYRYTYTKANASTPRLSLQMHGTTAATLSRPSPHSREYVQQYALVKNGEYWTPLQPS